jgi:hypothetical protein
MHRERPNKLTLLLLILGSVGSTSRAGDTEPEATLKSKGLTKTLSTWVIEDEKPVLASMKEAKAVFQSYAQVAERQAEAEQAAAQSKMLDAQRTALQNTLNSVNQQIASTPRQPSMGRAGRMMQQQNAANNPLLAEKSQLTASLAEVNQTQNVLKSQIPQPKDKAALDAEVKKKEEAFKTTLTDLRKQVDEVTKKYADLGADESIKKSIDQLKETTHAKVKLGPSDAFLSMVKEIEKAEKHYLGKTAPATSTTAKKKTAKAKK